MLMQDLPAEQLEQSEPRLTEVLQRPQLWQPASRVVKNSLIAGVKILAK